MARVTVEWNKRTKLQRQTNTQAATNGSGSGAWRALKVLGVPGVAGASQTTAIRRRGAPAHAPRSLYICIYACVFKYVHIDIYTYILYIYIYIVIYLYMHTRMDIYNEDSYNERHICTPKRRRLGRTGARASSCASPTARRA